MPYGTRNEDVDIPPFRLVIAPEMDQRERPKSRRQGKSHADWVAQGKCVKQLLPALKSAAANGITLREIARLYGLPYSTVQGAVSGRRR